MSHFTSWFAGATSEGTRGVPASSAPSMPSLADIAQVVLAAGGGLPAVIITIVVRVGVNLLVDLIKNAIIPDTGDMEEIADVLRSALLNLDDGSKSILKQALLYKNDVDDWVSVLQRAFMEEGGSAGAWLSILSRILSEFCVEVDTPEGRKYRFYNGLLVDKE
jgi:hypothetical protein